MDKSAPSAFQNAAESVVPYLPNVFITKNKGASDLSTCVDCSCSVVLCRRFAGVLCFLVIYIQFMQSGFSFVV